MFSKMAKRITLAAREGGGDPDSNPTLRMYIDKARSLDVPNDNIERAIKRGTGELEGVQYEEFWYEGYGPGGVALYVELVTDNRNRTAAEIRHLFAKNGGNLGEAGCVAWMFDRKGLIAVRGNNVDEEELLMVALESGAEDFEFSDGMYEITTAPEHFTDVRQAIKHNGYEVEVEELTMLPQSQVKLEGSQAQQLLRLVEALEDHDDVSEVYGNFDIDEEELLKYEHS